MARSITEILQVLACYGLHLPPDTTHANLAERICVAGHGKLKEGGTAPKARVRVARASRTGAQPQERETTAYVGYSPEELRKQTAITREGGRF